jgi:predicted nucleic acid-binding protein
MMLLDSDVCIDILREFPPAIDWLSRLTEYPLIAGPAALELVMGCQSNNELRRLAAFLKRFEIAWPNDIDQQRALRTISRHYLSNSMGAVDALIAETAKGSKLILCTFNLKHFNDVAGLKIQSPYKRSGR